MKLKLKLLIILSLILFQIILIQIVFTSGEKGPQKGEDDKYHIKIIASTWEFVAIDKIASEYKEYRGRIGPFEKGAVIEFEIVSLDVQHGFKITELDIAIALDRATGDTEGIASFVEAKLPNKDTTLTAYCHIFCGLGHNDMKIKIVVGEGSFWVDKGGRYILWGLVILNILIFLFVVRSIIIKVNNKKN